MSYGWDDADWQADQARRLKRWERRRWWRKRLEKAGPWLFGAAVAALVYWAASK